MPYCSNCGKEIKEDSKFCPHCGEGVKQKTPETTSGIICPKCGSTIPFGSTVCVKCGNSLNQDTHTAAIVIGYICSIFLPLFGIIIGIYLLTRPNKDVHKHGIIMIVLAIILAIVYYMWFSYMAYVNSMRYYNYYY